MFAIFTRPIMRKHLGGLKMFGFRVLRNFMDFVKGSFLMALIVTAIESLVSLFSRSES